MERLVSVEEEIPNPHLFWTSPPLLEPQMANGGVRGGEIDGSGGVGSGSVMNRSPPKWCFQNFMGDSSLLDIPAAPVSNSNANLDLYNNLATEENCKRRSDVLQQEEDDVVEVIATPPTSAVASAALDPVAYNAMLRQKLDADLAAVSMWRTSRGIRRQGSHGHRSSQISNGSNNPGSPNHIGDVGLHQLSSSSWDPSPSDDDMEGEAEIMGNMNVTAAKVKKRKESNRDSARRSRSRKAAHMKELEEQVSLLRVENNSLMRRLAEVSQRYTNVAVDNRVLKANVETLETKVKMSEETMKRFTGVTNLPQAIPSISSLSIPLSGSRFDNFSNTPLSTQDTSISYFTTIKTAVNVSDSYIPELAPIPTFQMQNPSTLLHMQPVVALDHHQKTMCSGIPGASVPTPQWETTMLDQNEFVNMGME